MDLAKLKLVSDKPTNQTDRRTSRRLRVANQLKEQSSLATQEAAGVKVAGKKWYWQEADGSYRASVKFGRHLVELSKGKFSVQCQNLEDVAAAFEVLSNAVISSQLDEPLDRLASVARKAFSKTSS